MDEDYGNNDHYRNLFLDGDECLLKGIVFLGTPFAGTGTADLFIPFIKAVRRLNFLSATSDKFLSALSTQQPVDITRMFRQAWSVIRERDIKILVGCEERPVAGSKLVRAFEKYVPLTFSMTYVCAIARSPITPQQQECSVIMRSFFES